MNELMPPHAFFSSFFPFMSYVYMQLMADLSISAYISCPALCPLFIYFCAVSPCLIRNILGVSASTFDLFLLNPQVALPLPDHFFYTHPSSLPLAPSLPPTSVGLRNYNNGPIAFSFASNSAIPFLSVRPCRLILSVLKFLLSFRVSFLLSGTQREHGSVS